VPPHVPAACLRGWGAQLEAPERPRTTGSKTAAKGAITGLTASPKLAVVRPSSASSPESEGRDRPPRIGDIASPSTNTDQMIIVERMRAPTNLAVDGADWSDSRLGWCPAERPDALFTPTLRVPSALPAYEEVILSNSPVKNSLTNSHGFRQELIMAAGVTTVFWWAAPGAI